MMKVYSTLLILLFPYLLSAQISKSLLSEKDSVIELNSGKQVSTKVLNYSKRVHNFLYDGKYITAQLRDYRPKTTTFKDRGSVVRFKFGNQHAIFDFKMSYVFESFFNSKGFSIYYTATDSYLLHNGNGKKKFKVDHRFYIVDSSKQVGMGYKLEEFKSNINRLDGVDLKTGQKIWERQLNKDNGWNNSFQLDDSTYFIVSSGLHTVNTNTGKGWSYHAKTGNNSKKTGLNAAVIVNAGLVGFMVFKTILYANSKSGICSNALFSDEFIYFASFKKLVKLNQKTGDIIWEIDIPKNGESNIWIQNNTLYLLNSGRMKRGISNIDFSMPYLSSYNLDSGKENYLFELSNNIKKINDFKLKNNRLTLLFDNQINQYSITKDSLIKDTSTPTGLNGKTKQFTKTQHYRISNNNFVEVDTIQSILIEQQSGSIKSYDKNFNLKEIYEKESLYKSILTIPGYQVFSNTIDTYIVKNQTEIIYGPFQQENIKHEKGMLIFSNKKKLFLLSDTL